MPRRNSRMECCKSRSTRAEQAEADSHSSEQLNAGGRAPSRRNRNLQQAKAAWPESGHSAAASIARKVMPAAFLFDPLDGTLVDSVYQKHVLS